MKAAQEQKAHIDALVETLKEDIENAEQDKQNAQLAVHSDFKRSGISTELYVEYEAFCPSLNPEFGQRGGFSIICHKPHKSQYLSCDPAFEMFTDAVQDEMPYHDRNIRTEASGTDVVEFWLLNH